MTQQRSPGRGRYRPWLWALVSTYAVAMGAFLLWETPAALAESDRFEAAPRCAGRGTEPPRCREIVPGVVERLHETDEDSPDYFVDVRVGEAATFRSPRQPESVEVEDFEVVYPELRPADRVEIEYWGRDITRITKPGTGVVATAVLPTAEAASSLAYGPLVVMLGVAGWCRAVSLRRRGGSWWRRAPAHEGPRTPFVLVPLGALAGAVVGALVVSDRPGIDLRGAIACWSLGICLGGVAGAAAAGLARAHRPRAPG